MYNTTVKYIKMLMSFNNNKLLLGRWNKKQIDTKVFWANSDHCGDPIKNKKVFEKHKNQ
jgi:hypothetical protein